MNSNFFDSLIVSTTKAGLAGRKIVIACDHAAFDLKERVKKELPQIQWLDCGAYNTDRVDYPDFADLLIQKMATENVPGVLLCGSGQGMALRANRYPHIRAGVVWSEDSARLSREHNNCNIICIGSRLVDNELCVRLIETFFTTEFAGGRHAGRLAKVDSPLVDC